MAKPKTKKKKAQSNSSEMYGSLIVLVAVVAFIALFVFSKKIGTIVDPMYLIALLAIATIPCVMKFLMKLNAFAEQPNTLRTFIPFFNESASFLSRPLEIAYDVLLILTLLSAVSMFLGNFVPYLSIPYLLGTLLYGGSDVLNNGAVLSLYVYQTYFLLICYVLLCIVRGIAYCQLDSFIAKEDSRVYLMQMSRRQRSAGTARNEKFFAEYLYMVMYFVPILRVLSIVLMSQRLTKLVVFNNLTANSKTRTERMIVETEGEIYE